MRKTLLGLVFTVALLAAGGMMPGSASAGDYDEWKAPVPQSEVQPGNDWKAPDAERRLKPVEYGGGYSHCQRLKFRCNHKDELGEYGEGNCRRYRIECGHRNYCEALRRACEYKYDRGQEGRGNCRRYRNECGGGY